MINFLRLAFTVSQYYNERTLEDLFELLEGRGAQIQRISGPLHHLFIPIDQDPYPFYDTVRFSDSISRVETMFCPVALNHP
jgi:hypothetical protein